MKALAMGLALALAACGGPREVAADHAWVRLAAVPGRPAAGYVTVHGGKADATLVSVAADGALRAEMHEMKTLPNGAMTMGALASVPVPAGADVAFVPGGKHLMLFDVDPGIKPGAGMTFTLRFADGSVTQADARVIAAGDAAPDEK